MMIVPVFFHYSTVQLKNKTCKIGFSDYKQLSTAITVIILKLNAIGIYANFYGKMENRITSNGTTEFPIIVSILQFSSELWLSIAYWSIL